MKEATQLVARRDRSRTVVEVGPVGFGRDLALIAGPCSVESLEQCQALGRAAKAAGANMFRGGAFKPRSSPYAFQGLGLEGLQILAQVREETGLPVVTEVLDPRDVSPSDGDQAPRSAALGRLARRLFEMHQLMESWNQEED